jgi:DNA-binding response OmpR family regulator
MNTRILLVEDEAPMRRLTTEILESEGHVVRTAGSAEDALVELRTSTPDVVILDVRLPGMSGFDLCRKIRETPEWKAVPIIFLTSKDDQSNKVTGLELGGDDYLTKPFGAPELLARVKALLRRIRGRDDGGMILKGGAVRIDVTKRIVTIRDREVPLTSTEFDLIKILVEKNGATLSRAYLMEAVWGRDAEEASRTVDQHVYRLRQALGKHGACVQSVESVGYRWKNL